MNQAANAGPVVHQKIGLRSPSRRYCTAIVSSERLFLVGKACRRPELAEFAEPGHHARELGAELGGTGDLGAGFVGAVVDHRHHAS